MTRFGGSAALIVEALSSRCSACGGNADPNERFHMHGGRRGPYSPGSQLSYPNGCFAEFVEVVNPWAVAR